MKIIIETTVAAPIDAVIEYILEDDRVVIVEFVPGASGVTVRETFDAENELAAEQQRQGWQAILDRFARHVRGNRC